MLSGEDRGDCTWVRRRVDEYIDGVDGGLTPDERSAIARHAAVCAACRAEIDAARAVLRELRALPVFEVPAAVVAAAEASLSASGAMRTRPRMAGMHLVLWIPAAAAAAVILAVLVTARWSAPIRAESSGLAEARVERATRDAVLALSYLGRYTRMTETIVEDEILQRRVLGTVERALDESILERGLEPPLRRAVKKSGFVETNPGHERS